MLTLGGGGGPGPGPLGAFVPLVYFVRRERLGNRAALMESLWVVLPAAAVLVILRGWWTP